MDNTLLIVATLSGPILATIIGIKLGIKYGVEEYKKRLREIKKEEVVRLLISSIENLETLLRANDLEGNSGNISLTTDNIDIFRSFYREFVRMCILYGVEKSIIDKISSDLKDIFNTGGDNILEFSEIEVQVGKIRALNEALKDALKSLREADFDCGYITTVRPRGGACIDCGNR